MRKIRIAPPVFKSATRSALAGGAVSAYLGCMTDALYSTPILRLAATIPHLGLDAVAPVQVQKTSRICGSRVRVSLAFDDAGRVATFGQEVKACALGQASASLMGRVVVGLDAASFAAADSAMHAMIKGAAFSFPEGFEDFTILAPVKDHKARQHSVMLPFDCLREAFSTQTA